MSNNSDCHTNAIVHKTKALDPVRDEHMAADELAYAMDPATMDRISLQQRYGPVGWLPCYLFVMRRRLNQELTTAHTRVAWNASGYEIHFWHRVVAFFHQEVELWTQGGQSGTL
jgi:hypothetical protein